MPTTAVPAAADYRIDALLSSVKWGTTGPRAGETVGYSFPGATGVAVWASPGAYGSTDNEPDTAAAFSPAHQEAARQALQAWAVISQLTLQEVAESSTVVGDIRLAHTATPNIAPYWGWAAQPDDFWPAGGDVWINVAYAADDWSRGTSHFTGLLHEIGHALGLKHPFEDPHVLPAAEDSEQYTVMSYTSHPHALFRRVRDEGDGHYSWSYYDVSPQTPMLYDIAAIQYLYGANAIHNRGDSVYRFSGDSPFFATIWDSGGSDVITVATFTLGCLIDLREGHFSTITILSDPLPPGASGPTPSYDGTDNLAIAFGTTIENAEGGAGNDRLIGNMVANRLVGNGGDDTLTGDAGDDYLDAGSGDDTLDGGPDSDQLYGNDGNDQVAGGGGDDTLYGGSGSDRLLGGDGDDLLIFDFLDSMVDGGAGNDIGTYSDAGTSEARAFPMAARSIESLQWTVAGNPYRLLLNGDGSRTETAVDQLSNESSFFSRTTRIDPAGNVDWIERIADNGLRSYEDLDNLGNQIWREMFQQYDEAGRIDYRDYRNDDGSRLIIDDDNRADQGWSQVQQRYDMSDRQDYRDYRLDDGRRQLVDYDQAGSQGWDQVVQLVDAQSREDYRDYRLDDGRRQLVDYDQAGSHGWAQVVQLFDAQGGEDYRDYRLDDGRRQLVDYDQKVDQVWQQVTQLYDTLGHEDYRDYTMDDGARVFVDYDQAAQFAWTSWQKEFDPAGILQRQQVVYDDGSMIIV